MIRNVKLKRILVNYLFPFFSGMNKLLPKKEKKIFIYCASGELIDNSKYVFDYLIKNEYNKKYSILVNSKINVPKTKNVKSVSRASSIYHYMTSKHIFYCQGKLPIIPTKRQIVINMWHGVPLKKIGLLSNIGNGREHFFTWVCAPSELFRPIMAQAFGCPESKVFICGEAKVDALFKPKDEVKYKIIVWAPTFRKSSSLGYIDSSIPDLLPIFKNDEWDELNDYLQGKKIKLIAKIHGGQDLNGFYKKEFEHFKIYSDKAFRKIIEPEIFDYLHNADALISDYSSVYIDYLVLNRPICFSIPDIEDYAGTRGFVFENPLEYMPGIHAKSKEDIYTFIDQVAEGVDPYLQDRLEVCYKMNQYSDGKNCERLVNKSGLRLT